jgi:putative nucleotidyltransferase with HDIG domain
MSALAWLSEVVPAAGLVLHFVPEADYGTLPNDMPPRPTHLTFGQSPLDSEQFEQLIDSLQITARSGPVVKNRLVTGAEDWPFRDAREVVIAPLAEGDRVFGWLAAFNHVRQGEFGTVEANLLSSVGTILGIHCSNIDLYRQQADLLAGVVRAMSSAIDAKDPYTRGHSDRVARVAVRLGKELGCDRATINTLYMAGLLHDIGKIGIDDQVLRKPGKLTDSEFEHVKTHVDIGYRILRDLRNMQHVLPIVLHHHESWDGSGYPYGLTDRNIPFLARIAAVADAYDAMASDRPYRKGMEDSKLDAIMRAGAGVQWDPAVVEAFFKAREDIRQISTGPGDLSDFSSLQFT